MFKEVDLFQTIETEFVKRIDQADGVNVVTMFAAHSAWAMYILDTCLVKKTQKRKVFKIFRDYNTEFYEHIAVNLTRNADHINLKGTMMALVHGSLSHLKKRENLRKMRKFALLGIEHAL